MNFNQDKLFRGQYRRTISIKIIILLNNKRNNQLKIKKLKIMKERVKKKMNSSNKFLK